MSREIDKYTEWDAAYVLGALSSEERWEYERHLAGCPACSRSLAELAGLPALLSKVPAEDVLPAESGAFGTAAVDGSAVPLGVTSVPEHSGWRRLREAADAQRRHARRLIGAWGLVAAAALVAVALLLPGILTPSTQSAPTAAAPTATAQVTLTQVQPSALSADVRLVSEPWGTRVESTCTYATAAAKRLTAAPTTAGGGGYGGAEQGYALYVTDTAGVSSLVASWVAAPGSTVEPVGTTPVAAKDIASVDIRSVATGAVLLASQTTH
jgi:anti-sigma factor RsiW